MTDTVCLNSIDSDRDGPEPGAVAALPRFVLSRRASFWVSAGVVAHTLWTSAAPAMVYRIYAEEWQLAPTTTTAIFAIYPIVGGADLARLRRPVRSYRPPRHHADRAGGLARRRAGVRGGARCCLAACRPRVDGPRRRVDRQSFHRGDGGIRTDGQSQRAASVAAAAQALGFAAALLLGGALVEFAPLPTRLTFWALFAVLAALFVATWGLPRERGASADRWRIRTPSVPKHLRGVFVAAALAMLTAYTHGVLILSLGGQVAHDLVGSSNAFVNGAILSLFAIVSGVTGIAARRLNPRLAMALGAFASAAGVGLLALAAARHALPIYLAATATAASATRCCSSQASPSSTPSPSRSTAGGILPGFICSPIWRWAAWLWRSASSRGRRALASRSTPARPSSRC